MFDRHFHVENIGEYIRRFMIYRLQVLKRWVLGTRNGVSLKELLRYLTAPSCKTKAIKMIERMEQQGQYLRVTIKGIKHPLYYPVEFPLESLYVPLSEVFYAGNWHEYEIEQTRVATNDIVLDCGAAEGLFSLHIADRCKKVYAIEPLPRFTEALELTFKDIQNVEIVSCALSDHCGEARMSQKDIASFLSDTCENSIPVRLDTIDSQYFEKGIRIDFIKADVEGSEIDLLKGAEKTIRKFKPKIAIATYHHEKHAEEIILFLKDLGVGYHTESKGIVWSSGVPVMMHAWTD